MKYSTNIPDSRLNCAIECYWFVDGDDTSQQKIIPDGFPEIIFHFGDSYELISENGIASRQETMLISGQISRPILLRATGRSDVFGIKFKPAGIWNLFRVNMSALKNQVIPLRDVDMSIPNLYNTLLPLGNSERVKHIEKFLLAALKPMNSADEISPIIKTIEDANGNISIDVLCEQHNITPRKLQRLFHQQVGVTAKQYARIVRFRTVYALLQKPSLTKSDSLYVTGYFDQPHFNKEFREFTNDNPEKWFAENNAFANLFMNR